MNQDVLPYRLPIVQPTDYRYCVMGDETVILRTWPQGWPHPTQACVGCLGRCGTACLVIAPGELTDDVARDYTACHAEARRARHRQGAG